MRIPILSVLLVYLGSIAWLLINKYDNYAYALIQILQVIGIFSIYGFLIRRFNNE